MTHILSHLHSTLPSSLPPRLLSRVQSAEYACIGVSKFDEMVTDGRMPKPKRIDKRKVWDRLELDEAIALLPVDGEGASLGASEWDGAEA